MTLFCVKDGDTNSGCWNQPLKKVVPPAPVPPKYVPTETKGIVRNTETGGLETNFPEPPALIAPQAAPLSRATPKLGLTKFDDLPQGLIDYIITEGVPRHLVRGSDYLVWQDVSGKYTYVLDVCDNWILREFDDSPFSNPPWDSTVTVEKPLLKADEHYQVMFLQAEDLRKQLYQDMIDNQFKQFVSEADWKERRMQAIANRYNKTYSAKV